MMEYTDWLTDLREKEHPNEYQLKYVDALELELIEWRSIFERSQIDMVACDACGELVFIPIATDVDYCKHCCAGA